MKLFGPPNGRESLPRYLLKYKPQFIVSSLGGILYNTAIVLGPILLGNLIDAAGTGIGRMVVLSALYFVGVTAFFQFARLIKRWFMRDQFNRMACDLRQTFIERILGKSLPELEKESVGDLMSRTVGDITLVVDTVMTTLNEGWDTFLLMISYFAVLMLMDWKTALISSIMVPVTILTAQNMRQILFRYAMASRKAASASNSGLQRYLNAISVIRLFGREEAEAREILTSFEKQADYSIKEMLLQQALLPVYSLIAGVGIVTVIALGGARVTTGDWTIGSFNAFLIMFIAFSGRTRVAARVFNRWHAAKAAWSRVKEKMDAPDCCFFGDADEKTDCTALRVENLAFSYGEREVLHDISFSARKGQTIGITGSVGSGKSSLAHALTGLYPYKGSITADERELRDLTGNERKALISYTGHEQYLFSMSIRENICFSDCDESKLDLALKVTALIDDMPRFEDGLGTPVGEKGMRVSGGQRQRISMARAVYASAPILLLDDPFSAVDIATEAEILLELKRVFQDRIVLLFTHRLTSFAHVDKILVLDKGKIVEQGTHKALLNIQGLYSEIYHAQTFLEANGNEQ